MIEKSKRNSRDQWFHGSLDRKGAEKLLNLYPPGSFLVRQTGDNSGHFSLSVVGPDKVTHHFVLEQKYGTICIGSSVYSNLESVIENYMSQPLFPSHDLSLQNPIYPSVLHVPKRVRCKFPYNADPETDELTVQFGEILVVHQESEPEWIWAESLLTGKHGAVFADLIEPLDQDSDPLLGHPWFNDDRSKEEIVKILKGPKVRAGTFIVRPSEERRLQAPGAPSMSKFYTLLLRGAKSIEKMLIERNASGRLVFGGRTFDSMNDLLQRYETREVREGSYLTFPLQIPTKSPLLPDQKRDRKLSSNSNVKVQKCGFLRVYSGKNPLTDLPHGSWKRFWARLDREKDEDQLTFLLFEHEKKSRPKVVHKLHHATSAFAKCGNSLFNKEVLVINNHHSDLNGDLLNSTWVKYLAFETTEECLEWSNLLDKLIVQRKNQIQIKRSVSVALHGGSGFPNKALDCLVCLDGIPVGRSLPQNGPNPHWHLAEDYQLISSLPETASFIIRKANTSSSEPFATAHHCCAWDEQSDTENAKATNTLPVATYQCNEEIVGAELRFTVHLDFRVLLPDEEFERLFNLLVSEMSVLCAFGSACESSSAADEVDLRKVALATVRLYRSCRIDTFFCIALLERELEKNLDAASLWRGNTFFTAVIESVIRLTCSHFLALSLRELVTEIAALNKEPLKMEKVVSDYVLQALCSMNNTADLFPKQIRHILSQTRIGVQKKWPDSADLSERVIANFLFLRYISAAFTNPVVYDLAPATPTIVGQKVLLQVAKSLQHAANGNFSKLSSQIQTETKDLLFRLSSADNFTDKSHSQPPPTFASVTAGKRTKTLAEDLDIIFNALVVTRAGLSEELSDRRSIAIIDYTSEIYARYKQKLSKGDYLN